MTTKELILALPISEIISRYIKLDFKGASFEALCPFHDDKNPSLKVNNAKGFFKCFSCGAGGDAFTFVMNYQKISFPEAMKEIAQNHSIQMDSIPESSSSKASLAYKLLIEIKELYIAESDKSDHLYQFQIHRKISEATSYELELGFAPTRNIVAELLKNNPEKEAIALELGLIRKSYNGYVDQFRNRIMFPISNENGFCVGFCGRAITPEQVPKYLNSKESFMFNKSELVYGLSFNKKDIVKESSVLIVEGFMDVVALHEHGIYNVVACMGVALSEANIKRLDRLSSEIILGLNTDEPGIKGAKRINELMLRMGIVPYFLNYGVYKDADEFLKGEERAPERLKEIMNTSTPLIDLELQKLVDQHKELSLEKKIRCLTKIFQMISPLGSTIAATERIIEYAKLLGIQTPGNLLIDSYKFEVLNID
jgi:DNA primase